MHMRADKPIHLPERGWVFSAAVHLAVLGGLLWFHAELPRPEPGVSLLAVDLVALPEPDPEPAGGTSLEIGAPTLQDFVPSAPLPDPEFTLIAVTSAPVPDTSDILSDAQLVGAVGVGEAGSGGGAGRGGGGGACDTGGILQRALHRDPMVLRAVAHGGRSGKAVMLWDGDWVRSGDQDGKGLSGVRQAIMWELAFIPEACRSQRVRGRVLLSLADGTRLAIGAEDWKWSDLLGLRPTER